VFARRTRRGCVRVTWLGDAGAMFDLEMLPMPEPGPVQLEAAQPLSSMAYGPDVCTWLLDR
jgi:hypothetical protein